MSKKNLKIHLQAICIIFIIVLFFCSIVLLLIKFPKITFCGLLMGALVSLYGTVFNYLKETRK